MELGLYKSKGHKDIEVVKIEDGLVFFIQENRRRWESMWYVEVFFKLAGYRHVSDYRIWD